MNETSLDQEIRDFYADETLAEEHLDTILRATQLARAAGRWKRIAIASSVGLAAMTLLAIGLFLSNSAFNQNDTELAGDTTVKKGHSISGVADKATSPGQQDSLPRPLPSAVEPSAPTPDYRLVAFRSHGNGCPHCRATTEVFAEIKTELDDANLAFEQFDLSDSARQADIHSRLDELQIAALIEGRTETAFLAVVDSSGKLLQEYKPSMQADRITADIRERLTK